jgi:hypothetical protein
MRRKEAGALEFFLLAWRGDISEDLSVNFTLVRIGASVLSTLKLALISDNNREPSQLLSPIRPI